MDTEPVLNDLDRPSARRLYRGRARITRVYLCKSTGRPANN